MKLRLAFVTAGIFALAACGSADDASTEAEPDTVEMPATDALEGVTAEPVSDPNATRVEKEPAEPSASEQQQIEDAGDAAAADAAAVADALDETE
ncbi:MAG: hypothetical protein ACR2FJ_03165 [Qipengyuania sp.]